MNSALIFVVFCGFFIHEGYALRCYNCSSISNAINAGCHESGSDMDDSFLVECADDDTFCSLLVVEGSSPKLGNITSYIRKCTKVKIEGCFPPPQGGDSQDFSGTNCFTACQTDGCNGAEGSKPTPDGGRTLTIVPPVEPKDKATSTVQPETATKATVETKQQPTDASKDGMTTATTENTTSDAQNIRHGFYFVLNLFVCLLCTVLFS